MQLNPNIEKFYLSILDYAGIKFEDNIFKNKDEKLGDITIDDKHITLPYFNNLKNPDGKIIFHPLNENYVNPETTLFNLYKKKLVLEINLKLSYMIINLITVASDVQMQQKIRSTKLLEAVTSIGEVDHSLIEAFLNLVKASKKVNEHSFILDIFLKKNGEIKDVPYAAIGKVNFILPNEIIKALDGKDKEYKVYGCKLRKKDLLALNNIFNVIFPGFTDPNVYVEGTDNKIFRLLNILLKTSYIVTNRINELVDLLETLKEPTLNLDDCKFNHEWTEIIETLYGMNNEIRLIPNQTDAEVEAKHLKVDESKAKNVSVNTNPPEFNPNNIPQNTTPQQPVYTQQQVMQPQPQMSQPRQLTPEEIIRGNLQPQPVMQPSMMMPMAQQPTFTPSWVIQETMQQNPQQGMMQQPMMQQPMMQPGMMQPIMQPMMQPGMMQPMMQPGMMQQPMMQPGMMQQPMMQQSSGLTLNPHFLGGGFR